jgi:transcriptional regulator with XRE-family HTH domain
VKKMSGKELAKKLGIPASRGIEAILKAKLIAAVAKEVEAKSITHAQLAKRSGLPRSAVTGILSGSLQKITIDRVLRLVEAVGLEPELRLHRVAWENQVILKGQIKPDGAVAQNREAWITITSHRPTLLSKQCSYQYDRANYLVHVTHLSSRKGSNRKGGLTLFLDDPEVAIENNMQERLLRSHVVGRKTWYGTHSERGAKTAGILFSLVETCKLNHVNPREYFKNLVQDLLAGKNPHTPMDFRNFVSALSDPFYSRK